MLPGARTHCDASKVISALQPGPPSAHTGLETQVYAQPQKPRATWLWFPWFPCSLELCSDPQPHNPPIVLVGGVCGIWAGGRKALWEEGLVSACGSWGVCLTWGSGESLLGATSKGGPRSPPTKG